MNACKIRNIIKLVIFLVKTLVVRISTKGIDKRSLSKGFRLNDLVVRTSTNTKNYIYNDVIKGVYTVKRHCGTFTILSQSVVCSTLRFKISS